GYARVFAREIGAHLRPALAAAGGLEEELIAEVESVRVGLRKDQWQRPRVPRRNGKPAFGRDVFGLAGQDVAAGHGVAEENLRVKRVGRRVAALATRADRGPVVHGDLRMAAA